MYKIITPVLTIALVIMSCSNHTVLSRSKNYKTQNVMYQYGIVDALLAGVFDGYLSISELRKKGGFGLGTFNRADGELIAFNDTVYKVAYDGSVHRIANSDSTPFAMVKYFSADTVIFISGNNNYDNIQQRLKNYLNANSMYAIRMSGVYSKMTARAAAPGVKPYPTLGDLLKTNQNLFNFTNINGDCIGFFMPPYMARTNVPGFHFHFLSTDKTSGGHVFAFTTERLRIEIDEIETFVVENSKHPDFKKVNLAQDRSAELKRIE
ncbi:MAG: acetolactate decarboxylase [Bacteroidota bacterium]